MLIKKSKIYTKTKTKNLKVMHNQQILPTLLIIFINATLFLSANSTNILIYNLFYHKIHNFYIKPKKKSNKTGTTQRPK